MNYKNSNTPFTKSILAGLATGIMAALVNMVFNYIYRSVTKLDSLVSLVNVETIIFGSLLLSSMAGLVYYFVVVYLGRSSKHYIYFTVTILIIVIFIGMSLDFLSDPGISHLFRGLYFGLVVITGLSIMLLLPWLARHKNVFFN